MTQSTRGNLARLFTLGITALLMVVLVALNIRAGFNGLVLLVQLVPLAMPLPGIVKRHMRSAQWLCFVTLFFLVQGILLAFTPTRLIMGLTETLICLLLFVSAIIFIRTSRNSG